MKEFGPLGRHPGAPLDPPMIFHWFPALRLACQVEHEPCISDFDCAIGLLPNKDSDPHTSAITNLG